MAERYMIHLKDGTYILARNFTFERGLIVVLEENGDLKSYDRKFVNRIFSVKYRKTQKDGLYRGKFEEVSEW